jgi:hypothetical protein
LGYTNVFPSGLAWPNRGFWQLQHLRMIRAALPATIFFGRVAVDGSRTIPRTSVRLDHANFIVVIKRFGETHANERIV